MWDTILLSLLRCPSLVCTTKLRFDNISMMKPTTCLSGMVQISFRLSPRCHTVSYAAVKSRNTTPAFSLCSKLSTMYWVSSITWPTVDLPRRNPACSRGRCESTTGSMRLWINLSRNLNGAQSSEMGLYDFGSCAGLFGFRRPTTVARRQVFGSLHLRKHDVKNEYIQAVVFALWWMTNSGWMLSRPGALPGFNFLMAASSYSAVKSDDRLASAVASLESEVTSRDVQRAKSLSASGNHPLFRSCEAMTFALTGHLECVVLLPVSLFMVFHALRLECVKSTGSTTSVHLALRTSSSLWSSDVALVSMSSLVVACWCSRKRWLPLLSHPGMQCLLKPRGMFLFAAHSMLQYPVCVASVSSACGFGRPVLLSVSAVNKSQLAFRKFHLLTGLPGSQQERPRRGPGNQIYMIANPATTIHQEHVPRIKIIPLLNNRYDVFDYILVCQLSAEPSMALWW